jgi:nucleotide-binding universal stress UspA family protein
MPANATSQSTEDPFARILVAVDFSPASSQAVRFAAKLARAKNARLTLLHVMDINPTAASAHMGSADRLMADLWSEASDQMSQVTRELADAHIPTESIIAEGLPWELISDYADHFDVLVMGKSAPRHGWQHFAKHTGRRVLETTACPVLTV